MTTRVLLDLYFSSFMFLKSPLYFSFSWICCWELNHKSNKMIIRDLLLDCFREWKKHLNYHCLLQFVLFQRRHDCNCISPGFIFENWTTKPWKRSLFIVLTLWRFGYTLAWLYFVCLFNLFLTIEPQNYIEKIIICRICVIKRFGYNSCFSASTWFQLSFSWISFRELNY